MFSKAVFLVAAIGFTQAVPLESAFARLMKRDSWGGAVSLGPTKSVIINAVTTLIPGTPPPTQAGELFLWPGMSNGTGDLIQTTLESWKDQDTPSAWCGGTAEQWCIDASLFGGFGQLSSTGVPVNGDDHIRIEYTRGSVNGSGWNWIQNVTNAQTGAALAYFEHESGTMTGYGTGTECDDGCTGTVSAQRYLNTTITLEAADTTFGETIGSSGGSNYTGLTSTEGGRVWHITEIYIPPMSS